MAKTHYEVLGVTAKSTASEIRSAYRKIVLVHHPDRSNHPDSKAIFLAASESYEVLGDADRRREYDARLAVEARLSNQPKPRPRPQSTPSARLAEIKLDVNRLSTLFSRGRYGDAETLARSILDRDPKQPVPYRVLGDLARLKGHRREALNMYAHAAQFDPHNVLYRRCYKELLGPTQTPVQSRMRPPERTNQMFAPLFGLGLILIACSYIYFAKEAPLFPGIKLISTWTLGLVAMMFFSGVVLGSCLALDGQLDSFSSMGSDSLGRISPTVALASIAAVNFWGAVALYVILGIQRTAFNVTTSRVVASVAAGTALLALFAEASGNLSGLQVFLWGGNLVYLGTLCGWMATDALRGSQ